MDGIDLSFSAPYITPEWCKARLFEGQQLLVVDLWKGDGQIPEAEYALRTFREAGGLTAAYFIVHDGLPAAVHLREAVKAAGKEWGYLKFVAVDVEINTTSPETVRDGCNLVMAHGKRPMIYTSINAWDRLTGNNTTFGDIPLWDASYGQIPSLEMSPPYGGWDARTGHQYLGTTDMDGIEVDLDLFDDAFVLGPAQTVPPEINVDRVYALTGTAWGIAGGLDGVKSPFAQQLRDVVIGLEEEMGLRPKA